MNPVKVKLKVKVKSQVSLELRSGLELSWGQVSLERGQFSLELGSG